MGLTATTAGQSVPALAGPVATVGAWATMNVTMVPLLNVPVAVLVMCATGSLVSHVIGAPTPNRRALLKMSLAATLLGATLVGFLPAFWGWDWAETERGAKALPSFGFIISLFLRFLVPVVVDLAPATVRGLLRRFLGIEADPPVPPNPPNPPMENRP